MTASRRVQRSVRVSLAVGLLVIAAAVVAAAVITTTWLGAAAIFAVLSGAVSSRVVYTEVTQTRTEAAVERARLAREFGAAMTLSHHEHAAFTTMMTARVAARDQTIVELNGTIRLAEKRADEAEVRVKREAKRANDAQEHLATLLDEVLTAQAEALAGVGIPEAADLPTVVDLLAWEDRTSEALLDELRHHA